MTRPIPLEWIGSMIDYHFAPERSAPARNGPSEAASRATPCRTRSAISFEERTDSPWNHRQGHEWSEAIRTATGILPRQRAAAKHRYSVCR